jgi:uncharacterized protein (TIGR03435 family)
MAAAGGLVAQSRPAFEVASVKRNTTNGASDTVPRRSGDRVIMHNTRLANIVTYTYHIKRAYEMAGNCELPEGWDWLDVEAKVEGSPGDDEIRLMFQTLLEDRFHLKVHRETREMALYDLMIAKGGPRLTPASENSKITVDGRPIPKGSRGVLGVDGGHLVGKGATIAEMVDTLCIMMRGPVEDRTGLPGTYDYDVLYARENKPNDMGPALPAAIQNELGLKLARSKGLVEVLVIDQVEKPSEN